MTIAVGQKLPSADLYIMGEKGPEKVSTDQLFAGRKTALFAVPGAFTPTCSQAHLPGYLARCDDLRSKGIDQVAWQGGDLACGETRGSLETHAGLRPVRDAVEGRRAPRPTALARLPLD